MLKKPIQPLLPYGRGSVITRQQAMFGLLIIVTGLMLAPVGEAKRNEPANPHGRVTFPDGSSPELLVTIELACGGRVKMTRFSGSEGSFTIGNTDPAGCEVRAYLPGYRSKAVPLSGVDLGTLVIEPRGKNDAATRNTRTKELKKDARRAYEKALDEAAKGRWRASEDAFQSTIKLFPWAASPWLGLGMVQERQSDLVAAKNSYKRAIALEGGFVLPYFQAAVLEVSRGDWQEALDDSNKVLGIDAQAYPGALLMNAWANLNTHRMEVAEKSAREGIKVDTEHRFPELEYVLGLVSLDKVDRAGAIEHLKAYLALDPDGARSAAAKQELARLEEPKQSTP